MYFMGGVFFRGVVKVWLQLLVYEGTREDKKEVSMQPQWDDLDHGLGIIRIRHVNREAD